MKKFKELGNRIYDRFEQVANSDRRPLEKGYSLWQFLRLCKGEMLLQILFHIKDRFPKDFLSQDDIRNRFYHLGNLPFDPNKYRFGVLLGRGISSVVYLLESQSDTQKSLVIKILSDEYIREEFGNDPEEALVFLRNEIATVKFWYGPELEHIFLPEYYLQTQNPRKKLPEFIATFRKKQNSAKNKPQRQQEKMRRSAVILQPFEGDQLRDLLTEIDDKEFCSIAQKDPKFKQDVLLFIQKTFDHEKTHQETIDLIGRLNVAVATGSDKSKPEYRLIILDPHMIHSTVGDDKSVLNTKKCLRRLNEIQKILLAS